MARIKYDVSHGKDKWIVQKDGKLVVKKNGEYELLKGNKMLWILPEKKQEIVDTAN